jgi:hypothetical protein
MAAIISVRSYPVAVRIADLTIGRASVGVSVNKIFRTTLRGLPHTCLLLGSVVASDLYSYGGRALLARSTPGDSKFLMCPGGLLKLRGVKLRKRIFHSFCLSIVTRSRFYIIDFAGRLPALRIPRLFSLSWAVAWYATAIPGADVESLRGLEWFYLFIGHRNALLQPRNIHARSFVLSAPCRHTPRSHWPGYLALSLRTFRGVPFRLWHTSL